MAEKKGLVNPNKLAMSRALGAAFLNHQVEQLEKTVSSNGTSSGNWRNRRQQGTPHSSYPQVASNPKQSKQALPTPGGIMEVNRRDREFPALSGRPQARERNGVRTHHPQDSSNAVINGRRRSSEDKGTREKEKDADVVVVDASVLVHALYQVKKWCRDGREEVIIIPLEALNTLDLLKKGTTPLAQRARAASRILEAQVGTNPRIRVQQDDAFVLWDKIDFGEAPEHVEGEISSKLANPSHSPEWVRRTISCVRWEVEHAEGTDTNKEEKHEESATNSHPKPESGTKNATAKPKVVLAVLGTHADISPSFSTMKLSSSPHNADTAVSEPLQVLTPVPLPAPTLPPANKFEPRSAGALVAQWAARAHISIFEVEPTWADDDDRERTRRARRGSMDSPGGGKGHGHQGHGHHGHPGKGRGGSGGSGIGNGAMVERPPAVMAMMEMVAQPSKVVRVLARGEKLDPDP